MSSVVHSKLGKFFLLVISLLSFGLIISCVARTEERENFFLDTYIDYPDIRNKVAMNVDYDSSIGYMSYALGTGEIVLRLNYDMPETLKYIPNSELSEKVSEKESQNTKKKKSYIQKNIVELNLRTEDYDFNEQDRIVWIASLLSAFSYVLVHSEDNPDLYKIESKDVGRIFLKTLDTYISHTPNRYVSIQRHPLIQAYLKLEHSGASQAELDTFNSEIFEIGSRSRSLSLNLAKYEDTQVDAEDSLE